MASAESLTELPYSTSFFLLMTSSVAPCQALDLSSVTGVLTRSKAEPGNAPCRAAPLQPLLPGRAAKVVADVVAEVKVFRFNFWTVGDF